MKKGFSRGCCETKHGMAGTITYRSYRAIIERCYTKDHALFKNYGGRGITMCKRWLDSPLNFLEDMGPRPSKEYSIDRINNDKNYFKDNCKWSTRKEQANNTSRSAWHTFYGLTLTRTEWADALEVPTGRITRRILTGMSEEDAIFKPKTIRGNKK